MTPATGQHGIAAVPAPPSRRTARASGQTHADPRAASIPDRPHPGAPSCWKFIAGFNCKQRIGVAATAPHAGTAVPRQFLTPPKQCLVENVGREALVGVDAPLDNAMLRSCRRREQSASRPSQHRINLGEADRPTAFLASGQSPATGIPAGPDLPVASLMANARTAVFGGASCQP